MKDWVIVSSKSGHHKEFGYPIAEVLCRSLEEVNKAIQDNEIHDPVVTKYDNAETK